MINIIAPTRIHLTLLNMSSDGYRANGGIGFFINELYTTVTLSHAEHNILEDKRTCHSSPFPTKRFIEWLTEFLQQEAITHKFSITISGNVPSHYGFGLSTSIRMSVVEGIYKLIGKEVDKETIIQTSHRGGTSGIGVHGYFTGGFVFDLGHNSRTHHMPSRSGESASHLPLLLATTPMPNWQIGIAIPKNITTKTFEEEVQFFNTNCPIQPASVYETTYHALFGALASVKSDDFNEFCNAIKSIQQQEWKSAERSLYPKLTAIENILYAAGANAVGMSSLGPSLYFLAHDVSTVIQKSHALLNDSALLLLTTPNNSGREILSHE